MYAWTQRFWKMLLWLAGTITLERLCRVGVEESESEISCGI